MNHDNEKTAVRTRRTPFRAAPRSDQEYGMNVLPIGTHLGEFEILDLIGEGGFGIVYLAYDHSLERHVALKEYMPSGLATRTTQMAVTVRSQHNASTFTAGLKSFINEAKMLAQFDSPSLVKVHRFWEGNGTAYMVMPYYEGITLKQALKEHRITPTESWIRMLLADLFDAIETIHRAQCFHRDIAPDNILLLKDGRPLLLDFGAARRVIGDLTQCLTVILKPGFAPIEQYADIAGLRQGAWTDTYALAAVVYYLIAGKAPPPAVARMVHDEMVPAREAGKGRYSPPFLAVIDKALAVKPEQRFRSIAELRHALDIMESMPRTLPRGSSRWPATDEPTTRMASVQPTAFHQSAPAPQPAAHTSQRPQPAYPYPADDARPARGKSAWLILGVLLTAGIGTGIYWGSYLAGTSSRGPVSVVASNPPSVESSGSSGTSEQEEVPAQAIAPAPAEPAPTPVARPADTSATPAEPAPSTSIASAAPSLREPTVQEAPRVEKLAPKPERAKDAAPPARMASEETLWQAAIKSDTTSAYENYLDRYPGGRHAATARLRIDSRQPKVMMSPSTADAAPPKSATQTSSRSEDEEQAWKTASAINESPAYEAYLNRYPQGRYAPLAKDKIASAKLAESPAPAAAPQAPETASEPPKTPAPEDKLAYAKPAAPVTPPVAPRQPEAAQKQTQSSSQPLPSPASKVLKLDDQTMTGNFVSDPKTGIVSGTGKIVWANGNQFEGTLVGGIKEGKGKFIWNNGQRYSGDWAHDMPNGKGSIVFANGNRYEGDVKDGMPHGQGTTRFRNGDVYTGAWVNGKSQGHGRYTWVNGSYWEGEFRDDHRTGNGTMVFADGTTDNTASASASASGK